MRTLRFHEYGAPLDVLRLEDTETPHPGPSQIRVAVQACGSCDGRAPLAVLHLPEEMVPGHVEREERRPFLAGAGMDVSDE